VRIHRGAASPEGIRVPIGAGSSDLDMSTATAVSFDVVTPRGNRRTWVCSIEAATSTELQALYVFDADGNDVTGQGLYELRPRVTFPSGVRRSSSVYLTVE
jgi:hypothetical protein